MKKILHNTLLTAFVIFCGTLLWSSGASAAVLSVDPHLSEVRENESFVVTISLNSEQEIINTVEAAVTYSSDLLEVVEINRGGSFLTLWPEEPAISEADGEGVISFVGGIPSGSLVISGTVISIVFEARIVGGVEISFDDSATSILLNDGLGTPASLKTNSGIFTIRDSYPVAIESPTHPLENKWYTETDWTVTWTAKPGAAYSYVLSDRSDEDPDNNREGMVGNVTFPDLDDGIHYFILKEQLPEEKWMLGGKRRAMIDTTAPESLEIYESNENAIFNGQYFVVFSATDKVSGIDRYDIREGSKLYQNSASPYLLKDQSREKQITVYAYDNAGNVSKQTLRGSSYDEEDDGLSLLIVIITAAVLLIVFLAIISYSKRKR